MSENRINFSEFETLIKDLINKTQKPESNKGLAGLQVEIEKINAHFIDKDGVKGIVPRIEEQACRTNGRVRVLEFKYWATAGAIGLLSFFGYIFYDVFKIRIEQIEDNSHALIVCEEHLKSVTNQ